MLRSRIIALSLTSATALSFLVLTSSSISAVTETRNALIRVQAACTLTGAESSPHTKTIGIGKYEEGIGTTLMSASCNDTSGFAVYAIGFSDNTNGDTKMYNTGKTISFDTGIAQQGNSSNWAMKLMTHDVGPTVSILNGYNQYKAVPSSYAKVVSYPTSTGSTNAMFKTTYAVYISPSQAAGTYIGKVKYVLVHPASAAEPGTFDSAYAMAGKTKDNTSQKYKLQDMSASICGNVDNGQKTELVDTRDGTVYHVGKLADGRCWLLDNLALDLTNSTVLNNLTADNTNADTTALGYLKGTTTRDPSTNPDGNYATAGVANWTSSYSYSAPLVNMDSKNVEPTYDEDEEADEPLAPEVRAGHWKVGGYYNYCAASAGSYCYGNGTNHGTPVDKPATDIDAEYDICPSGWRMPTSGDSDEYQALANAITGGTSDWIDTEPEYSNIRKALSLPLSGNFFSGSSSRQGSYGYFWSSTYCSSDSVFNLSVDTSSIVPQGSNFRSNGRSVRCIAQ